MEDIEKTLIEIIKNDLERCKKNKMIPSKDILDIIDVLIKMHY